MALRPARARPLWKPGADAAMAPCLVTDGIDPVNPKGPGSVPVPAAGHGPAGSLL